MEARSSTKLKIGRRIEHDGKRIERNGRRFKRNPARRNLLRRRSARRIGRGPFQPHLVWVGTWRETRSKGPGLLEVARYLQAALLGWAVGYPVRAVHKGRLDAALPFWSSVFPRAGAGALSDLPADWRRGVFRASGRWAEVHTLLAAGKSALRDNHRLGRKVDYRQQAVSGDNAV